MFSNAIGLPEAAGTAEFQAHISREPSARDSTTEYKEKKKLAKRIIKAVQGPLEDAMRKQSELCRKPFEKELRDLDLLLENSFLSRRDSLANSVGAESGEHDAEDEKVLTQAGGVPHPNGHIVSLLNNDIGHSGNLISTFPGERIEFSNSTAQRDHTTMEKVTQAKMEAVVAPTKYTAPAHQLTPVDSNATPPANANNVDRHEAEGVASNISINNDDKAMRRIEPPTPSLSSEGDLHPFSNGGIPWYMGPFDPVGTTIEEERWTGRELVRGMSEELSDMDEEELSGLVISEMTEAPALVLNKNLYPEAAGASLTPHKAITKRRRWRGYH